MTPPAPVMLIPTDSRLRERLRSILAAAGVPAVDGVAPGLDVAVLDATGADWRGVLQTTVAQCPRAAILAVCDPAVELDPLVLAVVAPEALERELVPRIARLRARVELLADSQRRQRDAQVLIELTARYADATDIEELLHDVTKRLAAEMEVDRAALVVVDGSRQQGTIVATSDDPSLKDLRIDLPRYPEIREVVRTGRPVVVEDAPSHPLLADVRESVTASGVSAIAALPLTAGGKVQGVMLFRRAAGRGPFSPREVELLTTVAHATAIAVRTVRQLEWVKGEREHEKSARIAAEERAQALLRYASYFEHLSDGVAILDGSARVVSLNPAGLRLLDCSEAQVIGRHINELTNPADADLFLDALFMVSKGQVRTGIDLVARTLSGRELTLELSAAPLGGTVREGVAIVTLRDVTKQRALAEELRRTKEFLERLINASDDAVVAADMGGTVILFSTAAERLFGWTAAEVVGRLRITELYSEPATAHRVLEQLRTASTGGSGRAAVARLDVVSRTGERIPVNVSAGLITESGRETATVGIFTDLRDRLNLERKLTDVEARLLESEKSAVLVALAGTAAHELNQPLTSVMGYAELLKRRMPPEDPDLRAVEVIYREAERMADIVRKIGRITRFETKAYVGGAQIVDLERSMSHDE